MRCPSASVGQTVFVPFRHVPMQHFAFLLSTAFLCLLSSKPNLPRSGLELVPAGLTDFDILSQLVKAAKCIHTCTPEPD
jgi:hypothetical protein